MNLDPLALSRWALFIIVALLGCAIALHEDRRWYRWARRRVNWWLRGRAERRAFRRMIRTVLPAPSARCDRSTDTGSWT